MTLAKAMDRAARSFIVKASLTIVTYDCQNIFIVQATGFFCSVLAKFVYIGHCLTLVFQILIRGSVL